MVLKPEERRWLGDLRALMAAWNAPGGAYGNDFLGDNPFPKFVFIEKAGSWHDFVGWHEALVGHWGFRGQKKAEWLLHSSLDRAVQVSGGRAGFQFMFHVNRGVTEDQLLFRFRQQAHQYLRHPPHDCDLISWLALMQHHGAPTRLLDWTRSAYVATYFALEEETDQPSAIWAINLGWLTQKCNRLLQSEGRGLLPANPTARASFLNQLLSQPPIESVTAKDHFMVVEVELSQTDAWMSSQQGFFLCKRYWEATFNQLLMSMMIHPELVEEPIIRKLEMSCALRFDFLKRLRQMNIHRGSLFPGLDGFSQSLNIDWQIERDDLRRRNENSPEPPVESEPM